jgi:hypothetical protein
MDAVISVCKALMREEYRDRVSADTRYVSLTAIGLTYSGSSPAHIYTQLYTEQKNGTKSMEHT